MRKSFKRIGICFLLAVFVWCGMLLGDRHRLREELIRLHVVAASDSEADQALKLRVRDAVTESLRAEMANLTDKDAALEYLRETLPKIEAAATQVLRAYGVEDSVTVGLAVEEFGTRVYDTFALPAGLYDTLRITIGEGNGKNWWCVVFPDFCISAATEEFETLASSAGFSDSLTAALEGEAGYEIRFFLLDALGRLQNLLHRE